MFGTGSAFSPADATTYYFGCAGSAPSTTANLTRCVLPISGTITDIFVTLWNNALGSAQTSTIYFRYDDTTDTAISSSVVNNAQTVALSATGLSIAVTAGHFFEIKWITPTWNPTNPTGVRFAVGIAMK